MLRQPPTTIDFPSELPVVQRRAEIERAISTSQVVILCGETGSGKTTQLPKICLTLGRGQRGIIGHTQPRRIAARSVAARIAQELNTSLGQTVGYKVRFSDHVSKSTCIKLMTDGILLAETQGDRELRQYDTIIIDEAHERSLNIDFLIGYLKQLLPRRRDLKVIITSATIDPQRFSRHFSVAASTSPESTSPERKRAGTQTSPERKREGMQPSGDAPATLIAHAPGAHASGSLVGAPIVEVSGRAYPVETRYRPLLAEDEDDADRALPEAILAAVDECAAHGPGDVLIFLTGERDIREMAELLRKHHPPQTQILPLYSRLSSEEQMRVFQPHPGRRIVLATNVAETSITVPGIRFVVDPGFARISRYSPKNKIQRLPIEAISQASANQRAGRCGRIAPGVCIRLYSAEDFAQRPQFTEPEILRTNLASVILQMASLNLGEVDRFPFLEPPDSRQIRDGYVTLHELGAINEENRLTEIGKVLAKLPVDPRIGRMILAARDESCLTEMLIIAAAMSVQDARDRPMEKSAQADQSHAEFRDPDSDFLSYLRLWKYFHEQDRHLSQSKMRKLCKERFISFVRVREWQDIHQQLKQIVGELTAFAKPQAAKSEASLEEGQIVSTDRADAIHRALLAGLLSNIAVKDDKGEYTAARGNKVAIFPGSTLFKPRPLWIVAAEVVETSRTYARTVARIKPEWLERLAPHLVKRSYTEPHWQEQTGHVVAFERVALFGLTIVPRRTVHYGPIDPAISRQLFIQHALVENEIRTSAPFLKHNRELLEEARKMEAKLRRTDLLADPTPRFEFFDRIIPPDVYNTPLFEKWRISSEKMNSRLLFMSMSDLTGKDIEGDWRTQFPDDLPIGSSRLKLEYAFASGSKHDGVTALVPLAALNQVSATQIEWLVPGLLEDKVIGLMHTLPKQARARLSPVAKFAREAMRAIKFGEGDVLTQTAKALATIAAVPIAARDFVPDEIPEHLLMNLRVIDERGNIVAESRDLERLKLDLASQTAGAISGINAGPWNRGNLRDWDFGDLPEQVELRRAGATYLGYPALVDEKGNVALKLLESRAAADAAHARGVVRLFMQRLSGELKYLGKSLPDFNQAALHFSTLGSAQDLRDQILTAAARTAFGAKAEFVRTKQEFDRRLAASWPVMTSASSEISRHAAAALVEYQSVKRMLSAAVVPAFHPAYIDVRDQLARLMPANFVLVAPSEWLPHLSRFVKAMEIRLAKLPQRGVKADAALLAQVTPWQQKWLERAKTHATRQVIDSELTTFRWWLEEFRVSLFAQELKTSLPVSPQRLEKQWSLVKP